MSKNRKPTQSTEEGNLLTAEETTKLLAMQAEIQQSKSDRIASLLNQLESKIDASLQSAEEAAALAENEQAKRERAYQARDDFHQALAMATSDPNHRLHQLIKAYDELNARVNTTITLSETGTKVARAPLGVAAQVQLKVFDTAIKAVKNTLEIAIAESYGLSADELHAVLAADNKAYEQLKSNNPVQK